MPNPNARPDGVLAASVGTVSMVNSMIVPNLVIDPSKTESYEIELPVCTTTGAWNLKGAVPLGSYSMVFHFVKPVFSGTATAASVAICTYMSLSSPDLEAITLLSSDFITEKKEGGALSSFVSAVGNHANLLSIPFPELAPGISLFSKVAGATGNFLRYLGFSKPPGVEIVTMPTTRHVDNWSQFDGKSNAIVLGGSQTTSLGLSSQHGGGSDDELLLAHLCNIPGLAYRFNITPAMTNGSAVANFRVGPTMCSLVEAAGYVPTPLGGCALPFQCWVGDINLDIEVVASVFHRCTFLVAWDAVAGFGALPYTLPAVMQTLPNTVISVSGNSTTRIRIPYAQVNSWARVSRIPELDQIPEDQDRYNGRVSIWVINPLTSNGSTDPIGLNVYVSSDNIRFAAPQAQQLPAYNLSTIGIPTLFERSLPSLDEEEISDDESLPRGDDHITLLSSDFSTIVKVDYGPPTDLSGIEMRAFGEEYRSIKQLTSKLQVLTSETLAVASTSTDTFAFKQVQNVPIPQSSYTQPETGAFNQTFLGWFSQAFMGYRGGIRHTFHVHGNTLGQAAIRSHQWVTNGRDPSPGVPIAFNTLSSAVITTVSDSYAMTAFIRDLSPTCDVVASSLHRGDFYPRGAYTRCSNFVRYYVGITPPATGSVNITLEHLIGSADDANFVWFLGFPRIVTA